MMQVSELQDKFGVAGVVRIVIGRGNLPAVVVTSSLASAEIYLHGAHIAHFQPRGAAPVLFLSQSSHFEPGKPIRGGVPLVFPWFGPKPDSSTAPMHGFARLSNWNIESCDVRADGSVRLVLALSSTGQTLDLWPYDFAMRMTIIVASNLEMTLEVRNTSKEAFSFEEALHTYLAVSDSRNIMVEGLENVQYIDRPDGGKIKTQGTSAIRISGETDRLFINTTSKVVVRDPGTSRSILIEKESSNSTVVWNPWIETARKIADLGDDEWLRFVCVETVNARQNTVQLAAGATHRMTARISVQA